jgi:glycosyltransferase involved in cell wall biosynthesis
MRILVANHTTAVVGGAESYLRAVLPLLVARGHEVRMLTDDPREVPGPVPCWRGQSSLPEITHWAPDVAYVHGLNDPELEAWIVRTFPSVLFAHNYYGTCISGEKRHRTRIGIPCTREFGPPCLALYYPLRCGGLDPRSAIRDYKLQSARHGLLPTYRRVVVASDSMREELLRNGASQVERVPLFVAAPVLNPRSRRGDRFAFVGRLTAVKGPADLLAAGDRLTKISGRTVRLVFAGEGPLRSELERQAKNLAVEATFTGWLDPPDVDAHVGAACAVVLPSLWPEPFGLVGLEAARLGVPAVAYDMGGIRDWLVDGENGALVRPTGDRIGQLAAGLLRAIEDLEGPDRWGGAARRAASSFGVSAHLEGLERVFAAATEGR